MTEGKYGQLKGQQAAGRREPDFNPGKYLCRVDTTQTLGSGEGVTGEAVIFTVVQRLSHFEGYRTKRFRGVPMNSPGTRAAYKIWPVHQYPKIRFGKLVAIGEALQELFPGDPQWIADSNELQTALWDDKARGGQPSPIAGFFAIVTVEVGMGNKDRVDGKGSEPKPDAKGGTNISVERFIPAHDLTALVPMLTVAEWQQFVGSEHPKPASAAAATTDCGPLLESDPNEELYARIEGRPAPAPAQPAAAVAAAPAQPAAVERPTAVDAEGKPLVQMLNTDGSLRFDESGQAMWEYAQV